MTVPEAFFTFAVAALVFVALLLIGLGSSLEALLIAFFVAFLFASTRWHRA